MSFQSINDQIHTKILSLSLPKNKYRKNVYRILIKLSLLIYKEKCNYYYNNNKNKKQLLSQIINTELYEQIMYSANRIMCGEMTCITRIIHDKFTKLQNIANSLRHFKYYITSRKIFGIRKFVI